MPCPLSSAPATSIVATYFHDFWDFLSDHGYSIYRILPSGQPLLIERYDEDLEYFRASPITSPRADR